MYSSESSWQLAGQRLRQVSLQAFKKKIDICSFRDKFAYICAHKREWSNCVESDAEKQRCGYEGIGESVRETVIDKWLVIYFRSVKTLGNVATIPVPKSNAFCHLVTRIDPKTVAVE